MKTGSASPDGLMDLQESRQSGPVVAVVWNLGLFQVILAGLDPVVLIPGHKLRILSYQYLTSSTCGKSRAYPREALAAAPPGGSTTKETEVSGSVSICLPRAGDA